MEMDSKAMAKRQVLTWATICETTIDADSDVGTEACPFFLVNLKDLLAFLEGSFVYLNLNNG